LIRSVCGDLQTNFRRLARLSDTKRRQPVDLALCNVHTSHHGARNRRATKHLDIQSLELQSYRHLCPGMFLLSSAQDRIGPILSQKLNNPLNLKLKNSLSLSLSSFLSQTHRRNLVMARSSEVWRLQRPTIPKPKNLY